MQDITSLQDYLIADEIQRISSLTREALVRELVELRSRAIENSSPQELLKIASQEKHG
ncbi:MAG: hypothetical protein Q7S76_04215 [bacterium]|nr:hypothetical protein [bacterium]